MEEAAASGMDDDEGFCKWKIKNLSLLLVFCESWFYFGDLFFKRTIYCVSRNEVSFDKL